MYEWEAFSDVGVEGVNDEKKINLSPSVTGVLVRNCSLQFLGTFTK